MSNDTYSILVRNACKKYFESTEYVLNELNMTVRAGSTYGLLGPSGCGKTTLLKCILGKLDIDCGTIQVSATRWKQIGYMPQAVSLHEVLTLEELFIYYGTGNAIFGSALSNRVQELSTLLELPTLDRTIEVCSGGEKRRISLAATLLHNPEIIILDEPTVGLDPLLSNKIINYLISLSVNEGKTILITTHYMEEARVLHTVGLMRGGVLLEEAPPESLITKYNCDTIDQVFVNVINSTTSEQEDDHRERAKGVIKAPHRLQSDRFLDRNHLRALLYKNFKWSIRTISVTLFILIFPSLNMLCYLYGYSNEEIPKKLGYYNEELLHGNCSVKDAVLVDECPPSNLYSCEFVDIVRKKLRLADFNSLDEGLIALKQGKTYGMLYIPRNFSMGLSSMMHFRKMFDDELYEEQQAHVWLDNTMYYHAFTASRKLIDSTIELFEAKCKECSLDTRLSYGIQRQPDIFGGKKYTHMSGWIPGLTFSVLFFSTYLYSSSLLFMEKTSGILERDQMNGQTNAEIIYGVIIYQIPFMCFQVITSMITVFGIFNEPCQGDYSLLFTLLILGQILGSFTGILVGLILSYEYLITFLGLGIYFATVKLNGLMWPPQGIHWLLRQVSFYFPVMMATESFINITHRGMDITSPRVYAGFINVTLSIIIVIGLIYLRIKLNNNQL